MFFFLNYYLPQEFEFSESIECIINLNFVLSVIPALEFDVPLKNDNSRSSTWLIIDFKFATDTVRAKFNAEELQRLLEVPGFESLKSYLPHVMGARE